MAPGIKLNERVSLRCSASTAIGEFAQSHYGYGRGQNGCHEQSGDRSYNFSLDQPTAGNSNQLGRFGSYRLLDVGVSKA